MSDMPPASPPLHLRLKQETREAHDAIEIAFDLDSSLVSREAYGILIQTLHGFHRAYEAEARRHLGGTPLAAYLGRSARLERDLAALGLAPDPVPANLPLADRAEALGAAYVVEGSSLGGLFIAKAVEKALGLGPETGNAFFSGEGKDTARHWRAFTADLDALAAPAEHDRVVAAANRTFAIMQQHLGRRALRAAA